MTSDQHPAAPADPGAKYREGQAAFKRLTRPIAVPMAISRVLGVVYGVLAVVPYVILVHLGGVLLEAWDRGEGPDAARVGAILAWLIGAFCARLGIYYVALLVTHIADIRFGHYVREQIVRTMSRAPLAWFSATASGRIRKAVQDDTHEIHTVIAHAPVESTAAVASPLSLVVYAFVIDWRLGLLSIATLPVYALITWWMTKDMGPKTAEMDQHLAEVSATMVEFVTGITVVKAFGRVGDTHGRFRRAAETFSSFYVAWCQPLLTGSALATSVVSPAVLLLVNLGGGALLVGAGCVTPVQVIACSLIALVIPQAIEVLTSTTWAYQLAGAAALRLVEILDIPALEDTGKRVPDGHDIVLDHVSFSYGDLLALDDVSLTMREGTVTALVGPSGSGKSTLATLIARFADPDSGSVALGGVDLRDIPVKELYRHVAFVLQDPQLLDIPIRDNIALGRPGATDEEIMRCAAHAGIADFIESLPAGLDTVVGADTDLSGGQAQRVSIARALLMDAPVLVLDEATAFTDPESEAEIQDALSELVKGRTVVVIAHRAAPVAGADQIVVLERGRITGKGTSAELADHPYYRALAGTRAEGRK